MLARACSRAKFVFFMFYSVRSLEGICLVGIQFYVSFWVSVSGLGIHQTYVDTRVHSLNLTQVLNAALDFELVNERNCCLMLASVTVSLHREEFICKLGSQFHHLTLIVKECPLKIYVK